MYRTASRPERQPEQRCKTRSGDTTSPCSRNRLNACSDEDSPAEDEREVTVAREVGVGNPRQKTGKLFSRQTNRANHPKDHDAEGERCSTYAPRATQRATGGCSPPREHEPTSPQSLP